MATSPPHRRAKTYGNPSGPSSLTTYICLTCLTCVEQQRWSE